MRPDDHEGVVAIDAFGADLDGRSVGRQVGDLADFLEIRRRGGRGSSGRTRTSSAPRSTSGTGPARRSWDSSPLAGSSRLCVGPLDPPHAHRSGAERSLRRYASKSHSGRGRQQNTFRHKEPILGKGMAGEVRFRKQAQAGDAARPRELVPLVRRRDAGSVPATKSGEQCAQLVTRSASDAGRTRALPPPTRSRDMRLIAARRRTRGRTSPRAGSACRN